MVVYLFVVIQIYNKFSGFLLFFTIIYNLSLEMSDEPYLHHGVMIAVGAAFKFFSGTEVSRAPQWMIRCHLEFVHRIFKEPRKQLARCWGIIESLPRLLWQEHRRKQQHQNQSKHNR